MDRWSRSRTCQQPSKESRQQRENADATRKRCTDGAQMWSYHPQLRTRLHGQTQRVKIGAGGPTERPAETSLANIVIQTGIEEKPTFVFSDGRSHGSI